MKYTWHETRIKIKTELTKINWNLFQKNQNFWMHFFSSCVLEKHTYRENGARSEDNDENPSGETRSLFCILEWIINNSVLLDTIHKCTFESSFLFKIVFFLLSESSIIAGTATCSVLLKLSVHKNKSNF